MAYSVQPVRWAERSARAAGPAGEAHGHPAHDPQLERDRHVGFLDADGIKQGRNHRPADRIGGTVTGRPAQVRGQRLAGEIGVQFHDPQVAIGRAVRALEVRRDRADQVTGVVDQGRGLDGAESRSGSDLPVRREARVGADVADGRLRALLGRPAAGGVDVLHDGEVIEELRAEAGLGDQAQRSGGRVDDLDVPEVPAHERHRPPQDLRKQGAQPRDRAQVLGQGVQVPGRVRVVQDELDRRGEVLHSPGQPVRAGRCQPRGPVVVSGLRPGQRLRQVLDPGRQHEVSLAATRAASHPPVMGFAPPRAGRAPARSGSGRRVT